MHKMTGLCHAKHVLRATAALTLALSASTLLAQPTAAQQGAIRSACRSDYMAHCSSVPTGGAAALNCLKRHSAQTAPACQQALGALATPTATVASAATATPSKVTAAKPAPSPAAAATAIAAWPHTVATDRGTATVYQPQIMSWPERRTLNTRIALAVATPGAQTPTLGTIDVAFTSDTDLATRMVTLTDPKLLVSHFPTLATADAAQMEARIKTALANVGVKRVPLDTVLLSLHDGTDRPSDVALKNEPPKIFYSDRAASLLVFDGEPVLAPVTGTTLQFVVNTNWDVFVDESKTWYWVNNGGWLSAPDFTGPWKAAGKLPAAFSKLPNDSNFADVRKAIPGRTFTVATTPTVFATTTPAEIIVTEGAAKFAPVAGTQLTYVTNTNANLFLDAKDKRYYYLTSGRWFAAPELSGPWSYATPSLPPEFAAIPPGSARGSVLSSVPGTPQAQEALIQATIPQQATLSRATAKVDVIYTGAPKFAPIIGTEMSYAVNTAYDVIQLGDTWYTCWQGAWFKAPSASGPWVLADSIPVVIYTIPPSSPLYRVTYVKVYGTTPEAVTYGYTSGYMMGYVTAGVIVYGTGWYYPPYIYPGRIPIYYPYPYSYAGSVWYNSSTGAWARGGTVYGPYGGAVSRGTAYNPNTGAWAHGGAVYGPNGGAGAWSAYNPSTGSYAHGSASWNGSNGTANASFYNGRTGVAGATNQNVNAYGRWGSSVVAGPNQTVHTQSGSNARGSAGSFNSTTGAKGAGVNGANGNSGGAVKGAGGDVYAGANGNVYKKTDSGWQKWDNGSWSQTQKPAHANSNRANNLSGQTQSTASQARSNSANNIAGQTRENPAGNTISGQTERGSQVRSSGDDMGSLENDRQARTMGAQRQQSYQRAGGGSTGSGGGGFAGRGGGGRHR